MKLYMFRTVPLSIIRSLFTVHSAMVYVIQVCRQLSSRSICSCSKAVYKPAWHIPLLSVQRINPWWWTDELPETCWVSWQNKFVKSVHLHVKAVSLQVWSGPEGSRKLRFPDFKTTAKDGGKVVSLTQRPPLLPQEITWYSFLVETESTPGP